MHNFLNFPRLVFDAVFSNNLKDDKPGYWTTTKMGVVTMDVTNEDFLASLKKQLIQKELIDHEQSVNVEYSFLSSEQAVVKPDVGPENFRWSGFIRLDIRAGGKYATITFLPGLDVAVNVPFYYHWFHEGVVTGDTCLYFGQEDMDDPEELRALLAEHIAHYIAQSHDV
jgi:hypothetical protein